MSRMGAALALLAAVLGIGAAAPEERATLIRGARVFDGTGTPATVGDVLIRGDRIVAVGSRIAAPRNTVIVDARGLTLIPGLHDLHTHMRASATGRPDDLPTAYAGHLIHGVTSANDYSMSGEMLAPVREMTRAGTVRAPNLQLAIRIGVPGGHGTEYGWGSFFTFQATTPRAARLAVARALPYKPDLLKVFADGWRYGRSGSDRASMDQPTLAAIVEEAHKARIPVVTHTVTLAGAKIAAAAKVDALVHGIGDAPVDDELVRLMKASGTAYVPTLVVYEPQERRQLPPVETRSLSADEHAYEIQAGRGPISEIEARRWTIMQDNVRRLKAAGVRIGVGTDAGVGGVYHGQSAVREIRLLNGLGLTPAEALAAATNVSAGIIGKGAQQGRIAPGMRADLVLTGGRPDERVDDLHDVRRVFVGGREMPLPALRGLRDSPAPTLPVRRMAGPIDTGARADGRTDLDTLPVDAHESGADQSRLEFVRAERRLFLLARMGAQPQPFAQLLLPLTPGAVQLADARGFTGVAFDARGSGGYAMIFDSHGIAVSDWFRAPFEAGEARREVRIPFSALRSGNAGARLDLARLRAVIVQLEGEPGGTAWLELGNMRFY